MTVEGMIFFALLGLVAALLAIGSLMSSDELRARKSAAALAEARDRATLEERLEMLVDSIRDLDIDYDMGKITANVYAEQRKMLLGRAVGVLHRLDQVTGHEIDDRQLEVEAAILALRRDLETQN
jgi:hypothetical protein